jgi:hypothetical protein
MLLEEMCFWGSGLQENGLQENGLRGNANTILPIIYGGFCLVLLPFAYQGQKMLLFQDKILVKASYYSATRKTIGYNFQR